MKKLADIKKKINKKNLINKNEKKKNKDRNQQM